MAINLSGQVSIGGVVVGESIELELAMDGTTELGLGDPAARTLAGVPSGPISISDFYGV